MHTVWFTGLPSSGKTTLANAVANKFKFVYNDRQIIILDGDEVRKTLCSDLGFSEEDRTNNIFRVAQLAKFLNSKGYYVLCSLITPLEINRLQVKCILGDNVSICFVDCALDVCKERDIKGLYKKQKEGLMTGLTGVDAPYERPNNPDISCNTVFETISESAAKVFEFFTL